MYETIQAKKELCENMQIMVPVGPYSYDECGAVSLTKHKAPFCHP